MDRPRPEAWIIGTLSGTQREDGLVMMPKGEGSAEFTASQREGLTTRHSDQERTLAAMHRLEKALESVRSPEARGNVAR